MTRNRRQGRRGRARRDRDRRPTRPRPAARSAAPTVALVLVAVLAVPSLAGCLAQGPDAGGTAGPRTTDAPALAAPDGLAFADTQAREFDVAQDPADPEKVAVGYVIPKPHLNDLFWLGIARSADGGTSWEVRRLCGDPETQADRLDAAGCPFAGAAGTSDPVLISLADGTVLYVGVMLRADSVVLFAARFPPDAMEPESVHVVARSAYNAVDGAHRVPTPYGVYYNGKANLLLDRDGETVHLVWAANLLAATAGGAAPNLGVPVWSTSTDGGRTWTTPVTLSEHGFGDPDAPFAVGVDAFQTLDGALHAVWWDGRSNALYQVTSTDGADTFTAPRRIADAPARAEDAPVDFSDFTRPWVGVDRSGGPHHGTAYVLFDDLRHGDRDVFLIRSRDHAASWSDPVRVSHASRSGRDETHGRLLVEDTGAVSAMYSSFQGKEGESPNEVWLARSTDGGETFDRLRLSSGMSPLHNPRDYNDLWQVGRDVVVMWEDGRGGPPGTHWAFLARVTTDQGDEER